MHSGVCARAPPVVPWLAPPQSCLLSSGPLPRQKPTVIYHRISNLLQGMEKDDSTPLVPSQGVGTGGAGHVCSGICCCLQCAFRLRRLFHLLCALSAYVGPEHGTFELHRCASRMHRVMHAHATPARIWSPHNMRRHRCLHTARVAARTLPQAAPGGLRDGVVTCAGREQGVERCSVYRLPFRASQAADIRKSGTVRRPRSSATMLLTWSVNVPVRQ